MSAGTSRRAMGVLGIIGAVAVVVAVPAAVADGLPANCSQAGTTVTCAFAATGAEQIFAVPSGVTSLTISATGAPGGGNGQPTSGSVGATASATVAVTPGTRLYVEVGGAGADGGSGTGAGGFNGGGAGGTGGNGNGGGGGGASDVRAVSCGATCPGSGSTVSSRLVVAAGGGGTGAVGFVSGGAGGAAGAPGGNGADDTAGDGGGAGGGAGTASGGGQFGAGGTSATPGADGDDGALGAAGQGGAGAALTNGGGGGGGGLYGGGGGGGGATHSGPFNEAGAGGGGGGSSYAPGGTTGLATPGAPAAVTIAYTIPTPQPTPPPAPQPPPQPVNPPTVTITKPKANATFAQRQRVVVQYSCHDGANAPGIQKCAGPVASGSPLDTKKPGRHVFTVVATSKDGQTASRSLVYRVAAPASKTIGESGNAKLVLSGGRNKLTVVGDVSAASGSIQGPVKLPGTCHTDGYCQTKQLGPVKAGTITFITELASKVQKLESLKPNTRKWKRATLSLTYKEGLASTTLSYALNSPWITSIAISSLKVGSKVDDHVTLKIHYGSMTSTSCTPESTCDV
jgi:hypothetical protein